MVTRMARKGLLIAPVIVLALWVFGGGTWAISGAIGLAMTLANLWLTATIIGRVAEHNPRLLMPAGTHVRPESHTHSRNAREMHARPHHLCVTPGIR